MGAHLDKANQQAQSHKLTVPRFFSHSAECWTDQATGNPSVSNLVSAYVTAQGETPTSSRAITPDILWALYQFNHSPENWNEIGSNKDKWCGPNTRRLLQAIYLVAFTCLLQIDEVLHIQAHDLKVYKDDNGVSCVSITLSRRKNNYLGDIPPYILRELPDPMAHLCPVQAIAEWLSATRITHGYIFRKMDRQEQPILEGNIEILSVDLRWPIHQICEWGGWSKECTHLTIVKYLISSNDNPTMQREDFFRLNRQSTVHCFTCGRTCPCA
ncbi:hypothetical protein IW261DRAFT_1550293 [Armillaria novae-zelandiae]|uniref:Uncharacterized protein n=1 Tax=Armillaria novae-zelandiae TaxID=153914 RepID=A0AA39UAN9_9AGAR|nr:hypothetical protein IW261DRAFT_1550293 [Armillaria novae-zelandiae]